MGKKLMLAVAMLALVAAPAFASVQNVKVSGALTTTSIIRNNFSSTQIGQVNNVNEILGQTSLDVSADLTDNVSTKIGLLNERFWGATKTDTTSSGNAVQLETAYVQMKELLYSPLTLTVGRQPLVYGNQFIIGSNSNVTNAGKAWGDVTQEGNFDAIKAVLSYDPLTVDLLASRIDNQDNATVKDNVNLYGINANYKFGDKMSTVVEAYAFAKIDDKSTAASNPGNSVKTQTTYVPGLRVSTNPIEGLNVQLEGAYEAGKVYDVTTTPAGNQPSQTRSAYALQGSVNYALPVLKSVKPVVSGSYTYLSGDTKNGVGGNGTQKLGRNWDPLYKNQNIGRIFHAAGLDSTNSQLVTVSGELVPVQDVTTKLSWNGLWLAEKYAYVGVGGNAAIVNSSKYLGSEIDLDVTYAYTEDVKFGVSAGSFLTGKASPVANITGSARNQNATQLLTSVAVAF